MEIRVEFPNGVLLGQTCPECSTNCAFMQALRSLAGKAIGFVELKHAFQEGRLMLTQVELSTDCLNLLAVVLVSSHLPLMRISCGPPTNDNSGAAVFIPNREKEKVPA